MRLFSACALLAASATPLPATLVHIFSISEIENSPVLAVANVESVTPKEMAPASEARSSAPGQYWETTLRALRAFPTGTLVGRARVKVRYIASPAVKPLAIGSGPFWPYFKPGMTALIPLAPGEDGMWRLVADEGSNLTVPAIEPAPQTAEKPATGRAFILAELANTLANGTTAKRFEAAGFLRNGHEWPDGLRGVLEGAMGDDDDRWLELAFIVLASMGIPHSHIDQLMANENLTATADQAAAWLLAKGARRDYPDRLIRCTLRHMAAYDWGAANILLDFKDSPLVVQGLAASLKNDPANSIYAAWALVRNGQEILKGEALDAAIKLVSGPASLQQLQPASWLLRDYGSDAQFEVILTALRQLKSTNRDRYRDLFGAVDDRRSQRSLRAAAILIDDRRIGWDGGVRFCDAAAATVEGVSGQHFGMSWQAPVEERDRAVAAASAWLKSH